MNNGVIRKMDVGRHVMVLVMFVERAGRVAAEVWEVGFEVG